MKLFGFFMLGIFLCIHSCESSPVEPGCVVNEDCNGAGLCIAGVCQLPECSQDPTTEIIEVWASSFADQQNIPEMTLDGFLTDDSRWAAKGNGQWIAYELSNLVQVEYVSFAFFATSVRYFDLQISDDGENWTDVLTSHASQGNNSNVFERFDFATRCARYVRFVGHGSDISGPDGWNSIAETDINGFSVNLEEGFCGDQDCNNGETCSSCEQDCGSCSETLAVEYYNDFENSELGQYVLADVRAEWPNPVIYTNGIGFYDPNPKEYTVWILEENANQYMHSTTDANDWGLISSVTDENGGGFQFQPTIPGQHEEIYLSYNIMFKPGMDFGLSGKLPGLGAGTWVNDDRASSDGFIGGLCFKTGGKIGFYLYWKGMPDDQEYGTTTMWYDPENYGSTFYFDVTAEVWYNVTYRVVMNEVGSANGLVEGFINGKLARQVTDLELRSTENTFIDHLKMYWFYGGGDERFKTSRDEWINIDDVYLFEFMPNQAGIPYANTSSQLGRVLDLPWMR